MATIFISYRRSDSAPYAGRLRDHLVQRFGGDAVFMDVDDIAPGADFPDLIAQTLRKTDAILAVIGPGWLDVKGTDGKRRLDDAKDYVRLEITKGIAQRKRVIPLLVGGARMPLGEELPPQMAELARLNALEISDARFDEDMRRLISLLAPDSGEPGDGAVPGAQPTRLHRRAKLGMFVVAAAAFAVLAWWGLRPQRMPVAPSHSSAAPAAVVDGTWKAAVTYTWGATHDEVFRLATRGGEVIGSAGFLGVPRTLFDGRVDGDHLTFSTQTQEMLGSEPTRTLTHRYRGTVSGDAIQFVLSTEGSAATGGPAEFTARRALR